MPSPALEFGHNRCCNLEDFEQPELRSVMAEVFPHELRRFGTAFPTGVEYRKHWEVAMAVRALRAGGAVRSDAEILGVGAGNEPTIFHLTNHVARVVATDLYLANEGWEDSANASMLTQPELHWPASTSWNPRRLVVQHMDALALRYEDASFDGVFSSSSIEHFGTHDDVAASLAEMFRVLKPGGTLSISTELRIAGPKSGMPGILMFDADEVQRLFLDPYDWELLGPLDLTCSEATLATLQALVPASEEVARHVASRGFIEFHELDWERYPHIVLSHDEHVWTSLKHP